MENNWREKAEHVLKENDVHKLLTTTTFNCSIDAILDCMNLVFEATKKECADSLNINPNDNLVKRILNIKKPNL